MTKVRIRDKSPALEIEFEDDGGNVRTLGMIGNPLGRRKTRKIDWQSCTCEVTADGEGLEIDLQ